MTTHLTLGTLVIVPRPIPGPALYCDVTSKDGTSTIVLTAGEWKELGAVARVVEKAKEWSRADKAMEHGDNPAEGENFRLAWDALNAAVDGLAAGRDGGE